MVTPPLDFEAQDGTWIGLYARHLVAPFEEELCDPRYISNDAQGATHLQELNKMLDETRREPVSGIVYYLATLDNDEVDQVREEIWRHG